MKSSVETIPVIGVTEKSRSGVWSELFKARLTSLVLLTTLVGLYMGSQGSVNYTLMFHALLGTALVACGAAALNQLIEREHDGRMRRTENRPLPSGRVQPTRCSSSAVSSPLQAWSILLLQ